MTTTATDLSNSLADAIASASASVVHIEGREHLSSSGIAWSNDVIVTAAHTIRREGEIEVRFDGGSSTTATLAGRDESCDVAVLRTTGNDLKTPQWRDASELRVGHLALAAGRPGRTIRATAGIISGIGPEWRTPGGTRIESFISTLQRVVPSLLTHGTTARPLLGLAVYPVESGLLVISVKSGSAAESAGILVGDIIRSVGGDAIRSPRELHHRLRDAEIGAQWTIVVSRGGAEKTVTVSLR